MSINITVKDRKEQVIASFPKVDMSMTVQDFKKLFLSDCESIKKRKLYPARVRFTLKEQRGAPLADTQAKLSKYIDTPQATLYFKDLGP